MSWRLPLILNVPDISKICVLLARKQEIKSQHKCCTHCILFPKSGAFLSVKDLEINVGIDWILKSGMESSGFEMED